MKKTPSQSQFNALNIVNISSKAAPNKKVNGFDSTSKSMMFTSKIETLKNKPKNESIEEKYVKGLQDEIHYLELELKLLHEKDQAKHGQIDQLEKFFSDGVPINENILAIKNGFNNYKNSEEKKIHEIAKEKEERSSLIEGLKKRIIQMSKDLEKQEKEVRDFEQQRNEEFHGLIKREAKLKKQIELDDEELKTLKLQNRKMADKLTSLQRNKEIEMVMTLKNENHKMDKLSKIRESISEKQTEYEELLKEYEDLQKQQQEKSYVLRVEEDNLNLKKKAISMERELNALQTKAQEKQMELDTKLKERHREISSKAEMKNRVDTEKAKISKENSMKVEDIEKVAREKEISVLQKIIGENKKLSKYTQYYGSLLSGVEDSIQKMVEKKPQLKNEISVFSSEVKRLQQGLQYEKVRQSDVFADSIEAEARSQSLKGSIPPVIQRIGRLQEQIKIYDNQKEKLCQDIKVKEKQLDLILILKSLNLDEVQMSKCSSSNIQDKLIGFIRNWEQLQRNS